MRQFSASVWEEEEWFVAQCLEIDIVSQGRTGEEAIRNLREAVELFFECAGASEIARRLSPAPV